MVVTCDIEFDNNPTGTYYAGQMMTGKITLQLDKIKQVSGVLLKIRGVADTSWTERNRRRERTRFFSGHVDYIATKTYLLGSDEYEQVTIQPGVHAYTFACHLPQTCPSSFEGVSGYIRYTVKVALVRPWKYDQKFTRGFTVLKVLDLNYDSPLLKLPSESEAETNFCCGPCKSEPLKLFINLPQSGYVPGQIIPVQVTVTNDSNVPVEKLQLRLMMLVTYHSQEPYVNSKAEQILVSKLQGDPVMRQCKKLFNYELPVPATPPTCLNLCPILQVAYQVEVEAKIKGWHSNQIVCMPVTIGNIPLMGIVQRQPTNHTATEKNAMNATATATDTAAAAAAATTEIGFEGMVDVPLADFAMGANGNIPSTFAIEADIPPPTFEKAVHMEVGKIKEDGAHDYGQSEFMPQYPVFSKLPSPTAAPANAIDGGYTNVAMELEKGTWL